MAINCMSLAVWLGEDRKCFAAVVGSDLASGLPLRGFYVVSVSASIFFIAFVKPIRSLY